MGYHFLPALALGLQLADVNLGSSQELRSRFCFDGVEVVNPDLHHVSALVQKAGPVVRPSKRASHGVRLLVLKQVMTKP